MVVLGPSRDEILSTDRHHGQEAVLLWDERGVSTMATGLADDVVDGPPVAVVTAKALLGCPVRFGADAVCVRQGGPFVSRSIEVATFLGEAPRAARFRPRLQRLRRKRRRRQRPTDRSCVVVRPLPSRRLAGGSAAVLGLP